MNADQLRTRMAQLPRPETNLQPPYWQAWRLNLYDWILENNPAKFWQCPAVYHCMLVNHWQDAIRTEFLELETGYKPACSIPHAGPDDPLPGTQLSMNLIHQAYHIQQWEQTTGRKINHLDTIVEFGAGYGAMALLCRRLGFDGKYIIYDLPEFSLLQEYYLSQFGLTAEWNPIKGPKPSGLDLYMALYSLSEVEPEKRITGTTHFYAKSYLFLYSGNWEGWDNVDWFQRRWPILASINELPKIQRVKNWKRTEIDHLPDGNNWYSIGW